MASVDTPREKQMATALGWRTFQITIEGEQGDSDTIVCPTEYRDISCDDCRLCQGTRKQAKSITIPVHGQGVSKLVAWRRSPSLQVLRG